MSYTPLIGGDQIRISTNPLARTEVTSQLLKRCYDADILPSRREYPRWFDPSDVFGEMYLSKRRWIEDKEQSDVEANFYENELERRFWDSSAQPEICVTGPVGSGKSTLIDYFLRCHCLHSGKSRDRFDKKLIIHFDARATLDNADFSSKFFLAAQASIRFQCKERRIELESWIKRRPSAPTNVQEWVWAALEELTNAANKTDRTNNFEYIVLVIDNLDQTAEMVQVKAISTVEQWLSAPSIEIHRVFFPLWRSTVHNLRHSAYNLLRNAEIMHIGEIVPDDLIEARERVITKHLEETSASADQEFASYVPEITGLAKREIATIVEGLANGDLRTLLRLWGGFLRSSGALAIWRRWQANVTSGRSYRYELLDALITGSFQALYHGSLRVANLFELGVARRQPRDLLIGPHAMHLLGTGVRSRTDFHAALEALGYSQAAIQKLEIGLQSFNVFHQYSSGMCLIDYEIHDRVIETYAHLQLEPAYIDNVAMVTPVDPSLHASMHVTRGDRPGDFRPRVETTLTFLRFLRGCEDQFRDPARLATGHDTATFVQSLATLKIPCLWRRMAIEYENRLSNLRRARILEDVTADWWERTLADPLFAEARAASDLLTPLEMPASLNVSSH